MIMLNVDFYNVPSNNTFKMEHYLSKNIIDLLCVAKHYSDRYNSADGYLNCSNDVPLREHVLFLNDKTPSSLVDAFIEDALHKCSGAKIKSKNMIFVWKKWLDERNMPNIIFTIILHLCLRIRLIMIMRMIFILILLVRIYLLLVALLLSGIIQ